MELLCYGNRNETICLKFYPCANSNSNISWEEWHSKEPLVVFKADYQPLLLPYLAELFPCSDPAGGEPQEQFDVCFDNWIGKTDWVMMLEKIKKDLHRLPEQRIATFYSRFIEWSEAQLSWAALIVVVGNQ